MAPELINKIPYDNKVDIWALGCIAYELVCKEHPFFHPTKYPDFKRNIISR
jgi:serine/threonine protein kinase